MKVLAVRSLLKAVNGNTRGATGFSYLVQEIRNGKISVKFISAKETTVRRNDKYPCEILVVKNDGSRVWIPTNKKTYKKYMRVFSGVSFK